MILEIFIFDDSFYPKRLNKKSIKYDPSSSILEFLLLKDFELSRNSRLELKVNIQWLFIKGPFMEKSIEGVVLKTIDYGEYDQILTVFTKELGILPFFFKRNKSSLKIAKISPLVVAEFNYTTTKGALLKCKDVHPISLFLNLRDQYTFLETAGKLIQKIILSQTEYKQAPNLYDLLIFYLKIIPTFLPLKNIEASFIVKIIKNEGLLQTDLKCFHCKKNLNELYISESGYFCVDHQHAYSIHFNEDELLNYFQLAACKNLNELASYNLSNHFFEKLEALFNNYFFLH